MGIYIKCMKMPERCAKCFLKQSCDKRIYMERRPDNCPLISIPPHGRLIDADAMIEKVIAKYLEHERKGELVFAAAEIKQDIVDLISDAPTIIPADVPDTNDGNISTIKIAPSQYQIVKQIDLTQDSIERIADAVVRKMIAEEGE